MAAKVRKLRVRKKEKGRGPSLLRKAEQYSYEKGISYEEITRGSLRKKKEIFF